MSDRSPTPPKSPIEPGRVTGGQEPAQRGDLMPESVGGSPRMRVGVQEVPRQPRILREGGAGDFQLALKRWGPDPSPPGRVARDGRQSPGKSEPGQPRQRLQFGHPAVMLGQRDRDHPQATVTEQAPGEAVRASVPTIDGEHDATRHVEAARAEHGMQAGDRDPTGARPTDPRLDRCLDRQHIDDRGRGPRPDQLAVDPGRRGDRRGDEDDVDRSRRPERRLHSDRRGQGNPLRVRVQHRNLVAESDQPGHQPSPHRPDAPDDENPPGRRAPGTRGRRRDRSLRPHGLFDHPTGDPGGPTGANSLPFERRLPPSHDGPFHLEVPQGQAQPTLLGSNGPRERQSTSDTTLELGVDGGQVAPQSLDPRGTHPRRAGGVALYLGRGTAHAPRRPAISTGRRRGRCRSVRSCGENPRRL